MAKTINISSPPAKWSLSHILVLALLAFACYWPLTLEVFSVKNDNILAFLPTRFHVTEALRSGHLPLWTPYMYLGYPLHGDMQGGAWHPIVWLIALLGKYNLTSLHIEVWIAIFISGLSMYRLLGWFRLDGITKLIGASAFMMSGYVTDVAGSNLPFLWAAACIPFTLAYYLELLKKPSWKYAAAFALSLFLFLSSSYPAFLILMAYVLLFIFIYRSFQLYRSNIKPLLYQSIRYQLLSLVLFLLVSAPVILSYATILPFYERVSGVSLEAALHNSLHPSCTVSLLFPALPEKMEAASHTDLISRNLYSNLILFLLSILAFVQLKNSAKWWVAGGTLFFLLFSFGTYFPLRAWCYQILPFMDTFRHPSNARLFAIIPLIIAGSLGWKMLMEEINPALFKRILFALAALCLVLAMTGLFNSQLFDHLNLITQTNNKRTGIKNFLDAIDSNDLLFISALLQLIFLLLFYLSTNRKRGKLMVALILANSFILAQTVIPFTLGSKISPAIGNRIMDSYPAGFPYPDQETIADHSTNMVQYFDTIGYNGFYHKKIGLTNSQSTPTMMNGIIELYRDSLMVAAVLNNPVAFIPEHIQDHPAENPEKHTMILQGAKTDLIKSEGDSLEYQKFWNNGFVIQTQSRRAAYLVLQQLHLPGWTAAINGKETDIHTVNGSMMAIELPAGKHTVSWQYRPSWLIWSLGLSCLGFILAGYAMLKRKHVSN